MMPNVGGSGLPVYSPAGATLTVANGARAVTCSGAKFIDTNPDTGAIIYNVGVGDVLVVSGVGFGVIEEITDAEHLVLGTLWAAASQSGTGSGAWYIIRYSTMPFDNVSKAIQGVLSIGSDSRPVDAFTIDDSARLKLRIVSGVPQIAVGASGSSSLPAALSFNPITGELSFGGESPVFGEPVTVRGFVCYGDSLTYGWDASNPDVQLSIPYPSALAAKTGLPAINKGVSGYLASQMDPDYTTFVAPSFDANSANILILEGGINDIRFGGTQSSIDASIRSICAKARATGFKVYLQTLTPVIFGAWGSGQGFQDTWLAINTDRRTNWRIYCDGLVDVAANQLLSDPTNRNYYAVDGIHWSNAMDLIVADIVRTAVGV